MRTLYHGVIVCVVSPRPHPPDTFAEGAEAVCAQPVGRGKDNGEQLREHGGARDCYEGLYCLGTNTALADALCHAVLCACCKSGASGRRTVCGPPVRLVVHCSKQWQVSMTRVCFLLQVESIWAATRVVYPDQPGGGRAAVVLHHRQVASVCR